MTTAPEATETNTEAQTEEFDYDKAFGPFASTFKTMIPQMASVADTHNELVAQLNVKAGEISEDDLEAARLRNKSGDKDVTKLNAAIAKLEAELEKYRARAYELVQDDIPQPLTDEEKVPVKARVKDLRDQFKTLNDAIHAVAKSVNLSLDNAPIPTINTNGSTRGGGTRKGFSGPRVRTKAVYVNGVYVEMKKPNNPNETTSNLSVAAAHITKEVKANPRVTAVDLQQAYFAAAGVSLDADGNLDSSKLPTDKTFTYVYVNPSDKAETPFEIRVERDA